MGSVQPVISWAHEQLWHKPVGSLHHTLKVCFQGSHLLVSRSTSYLVTASPVQCTVGGPKDGVNHQQYKLKPFSCNGAYGCLLQSVLLQVRSDQIRLDQIMLSQTLQVGITAPIVGQYYLTNLCSEVCGSIFAGSVSKQC